MNCTSRKELLSREGDIIYITDINDTRCWKGTYKGKAGLTLSNYAAQQDGFIDNPLHEAAKRGNLSWLQECSGQSRECGGLGQSYRKHRPVLALLWGPQRYSGGAVISARFWAEPAKQTSREIQFCTRLPGRVLQTLSICYWRKVRGQA